MSLVSVVVPTLNEVGNIHAVMDLVAQAFAKTNDTFEMIFVDDQSSDGTVELICAIAEKQQNVRLIQRPVRRGLGAALFEGVAAARGQFCVFVDADVSVSTSDLNRLISAKAANTMLIGSRYIRGSKIVNAPRMKVLASRVLNLICAKLLRLSVRDLSHSLRIFPLPVDFSPHNLTHPGCFWEFGHAFSRSGGVLREIPVTFTERRVGQTKLTTAGMIKSVIRASRDLAAAIRR